jgi:hypothetical protein
LEFIVRNRPNPKADEGIRKHQTKIEDHHPNIAEKILLAQINPSGLETTGWREFRLKDVGHRAAYGRDSVMSVTDVASEANS